MFDTESWDPVPVGQAAHAIDSPWIDQELQQIPPSEPTIIPSPNHLPTSLIEHWFRFVCPTWSVFDSDVNYNRQLAQNSWTVSEPVFLAMQAMSVACMVDGAPELLATLSSLRQQAVGAISSRVSQLTKANSTRVTPDLVFAVFALGTSLQWGMPAETEYSWTRLAGNLLTAWQTELSGMESLLHAYFCQASTYWEMLQTAMDPGSAVPPKLRRKRIRHKRRIYQALNLPGPIDDEPSEPHVHPEPRANMLPGTRPNSWCGVSNEVIDAFAQTVALCRSACQRATTGTPATIEATSAALCDAALAHELERELVSMDFGTIVSTEEALGYSMHTRDHVTPLSHLLLTAEAYRQAAILQLRLTFEDLGREVSQFRQESLLSLTLELAAILQEIPPESGSSSMHPLLYLCTAAGLTFDACNGSESVAGINHGFSGDPPLPLLARPAVPKRTMAEVNEARQLVRSRLGAIQQRMPQRVRGGMLQLVETMWREYDAVRPGCRRSPWFEIWTRAGLGVVLS